MFGICVCELCVICCVLCNPAVSPLAVLPVSACRTECGSVRLCWGLMENVCVGFIAAVRRPTPALARK